MTTTELIGKLREHWVGTDDYTGILMMLAADALEELTTWIDFDDHYPELGVQVLVRDTQGAVTTGYRVEVTDDVGKTDGIVTDRTLTGDLVAWRAI